MYTLILTVHIIIAVAIVLVVLLQVGKGSGMGAAFGGSSESFFGSSGPSNFLEKFTIAIGIIFAVTSIVLAHLSGTSQKNRLFNLPAPTQQTSPMPRPPQTTQHVSPTTRHK